MRARATAHRDGPATQGMRESLRHVDGIEWPASPGRLRGDRRRRTRTSLEVKTRAEGPAGSLPLTDEMLRHWPSGDLFGLSQNAGMGWEPAERSADDPFLILSTQGGLRGDDGRPIALGYHTGHWEIGLLVRAAAEELRRSAPCRSPGRSPTPATAGPRARPA